MESKRKEVAVRGGAKLVFLYALRVVSNYYCAASVVVVLAILLHTKLHCLVKVKTVQRARPWLTTKRPNCTSSYSSCSDAVAHNSCTSQLKVSKKQSHENLYRSFTLATVAAAAAHYQQSKFENKKLDDFYGALVIHNSVEWEEKRKNVSNQWTCYAMSHWISYYIFIPPTAFVWCCVNGTTTL